VLLVQFFGFGGDTLDKLLPKTKFRDFHYQNSSDTAVPAKEWALRKRVWDHIFRAARTPAEAGLTFDLIGEGTVYELSIRVSEKMHGHKMGQGEGCEVCSRAKLKMKICQGGRIRFSWINQDYFSNSLSLLLHSAK
jgi:hypothetical protein